MKSILVSSSERHSGKSAFCLGLALNLKDKGLKVGYLKPIGIKIKTVEHFLVDEDAENIKIATIIIKDRYDSIIQNFQFKFSLQVVIRVYKTQ